MKFLFGNRDGRIDIKLLYRERVMKHIKVEHRPCDLNLRFGQYLLECFDVWGLCY